MSNVYFTSIMECEECINKSKQKRETMNTLNDVEVISIDDICDNKSSKFNPDMNKLEAFVNKEIMILNIEEAKSIIHGDDRKALTVSFMTKDDDEVHVCTTSAKYLVNQFLAILEKIPEFGTEGCKKMVTGVLYGSLVKGRLRDARLISIDKFLEAECGQHMSK